jgi:hypothetical protein
MLIYGFAGLLHLKNDSIRRKLCQQADNKAIAIVNSI